MDTKKDTIPQKKKVPGMHMGKDSLGSNNMKGMQGRDNLKAVTGHNMQMDMMSHSYSINLPMSRDGSGTSWLPDASPMYMFMKMHGRSMFMLHGNMFVRINKQDLFNKGSRGSHHFDAPNWLMGMYDHRVGSKGLFNATVMISLDPALVTRAGYPLLFQTGESYKGKKLIDRQHPHDLFSGVSIAYTQMLNANSDVYAYFGYPGEPALGPPAFMHRISAINNPDAPLGHHWQDATHITFGVGTLGLRFKNYKLEGSIFNGREPDEHRYDFDKIGFDSYSYRLSFNPSAYWSLQFSQGFIKSPELLEPEVDVTRITASVIYSKWLKERTDFFTQTFVWGLNHPADGKDEHSFLYEANVQRGNNATYCRYEFVQKSRDELGLGSTFKDKNYNINAFTIGYNFSFYHNSRAQFAAGIQSTASFSPKELQSLYGKIPLAAEVYVQVKPNLHRHQ